jgi:hypothetical protein
MRCDARRESFLGAEWSPQAHPIGESPSTLGILARVHRSFNCRATMAVAWSFPGKAAPSYESSWYYRRSRASRSRVKTIYRRAELRCAGVRDFWPPINPLDVSILPSRDGLQ